MTNKPKFPNVVVSIKGVDDPWSVIETICEELKSHSVDFETRHDFKRAVLAKLSSKDLMDAIREWVSVE